MTFGNLHVEFGPAPVTSEPTYPLLPPHALYPADALAPDHAQQNAATLVEDELSVKAEQLRMLMIENPMEYENALRDGELTEDEPGESSES